MSNYLAIATVTATIASLIRDAMYDVPNLSNAPDVRIARPLPDPNFVGAHLFLYRVAPNGFLRNDDLPTRNGNARLVARPSFAADLEYVLSFYGNDQTFEAQRLLGRVVTALHAEPVLSAQRVRTVIQNTPALAGSTLDRELQPIRLVPIALDVEDLSRMWSVFYQTPYSLSLSYAASVVMLDGEMVPSPAPAAAAVRGTASASMPRIDEVAPPRVVAGLDRAVSVRGSGIGSGDALSIAGGAVPTVVAGTNVLSASPPPLVGRLPVQITSPSGVQSNAATLLGVPFIAGPALRAGGAGGMRTLAVATNFLPDPRQRYTFLLYEQRDDGGPRRGAELDALVTWIDPARTGAIAAGRAGNALAGALNAAMQPAPRDAVLPDDEVLANAGGWAIPARSVALRPAGDIVAVTWGLAPRTSLAADVDAVPPGRYAVALRVDGDAALTSEVLRGTHLFALPGEPAARDDEPVSAALRTRLSAAGVPVDDSARTRVPVPGGGAFVVSDPASAPEVWLDPSPSGVTAFVLAPSGEAIAPLVELPA